MWPCGPVVAPLFVPVVFVCVLLRSRSRCSSAEEVAGYPAANLPCGPVVAPLFVPVVSPYKSSRELTVYCTFGASLRVAPRSGAKKRNTKLYNKQNKQNKQIEAKKASSRVRAVNFLGQSGNDGGTKPAVLLQRSVA